MKTALLSPAVAIVVLALSSCHGNNQHASLRRQNEAEFIDEQAYIEQLSEKLQPYDLISKKDNQTTELQLHQFLHLHHMKTGGTSMDGLLRCAMQRMKKTSDSTISYMNIHECGLERYRKCVSGEDDKCRQRLNHSSILSYCAPLMDLETFGWECLERKDDDAAVVEQQLLPTTTTKTPPPHAVTVLRHPVARVWSMFRFQTKRCYDCRNLTDIYDQIDRNESLSGEVCQMQLLNHQTRNLVSFWDPSQPDVMIEDAIHNMKTFFTLVGLTENMKETADMVGKVFPFMNETIAGSNETCAMPHKNSSPQNNGCAADGGHWELPDHPDDATTQAIIDHNPLDVMLYEQAVQQFQYQKMALGLIDAGEGSDE
jgi:hypothetical protein